MQYAVQNGSTSCSLCAAGSVSNASSPTCTVCKAGAAPKACRPLSPSLPMPPAQSRNPHQAWSPLLPLPALPMPPARERGPPRLVTPSALAGSSLPMPPLARADPRPDDALLHWRCLIVPPARAARMQSLRSHASPRPLGDVEPGRSATGRCERLEAGGAGGGALGEDSAHLRCSGSAEHQTRTAGVDNLQQCTPDCVALRRPTDAPCIPRL